MFLHYVTFLLMIIMGPHHQVMSIRIEDEFMEADDCYDARDEERAQPQIVPPGFKVVWACSRAQTT